MQSVDEVKIEGDREENSFVVFKHSAGNIASTEHEVFYYSPTFRVHGTIWSVAFKVYRPPEHNEDVLGLYIAFKGTAHSSRPMVNMEVELKLVNQVSPSRSVRKEFSSFLNTSVRTHLGFKKFMYWHDVITRSVGFIKEDKIVMEKSFQANALMLARVSPVFERMFFGELRQTTPVQVPDVHPDAFFKMLQFAYGCDLQLGSQEEVMDLYYVADKYLVADLQIACLKHVWPTDANNVWTALHMATFYGLPSLLTVSLKVVGQNIDAVLQHPEFCALSANSLLTLVQAHELKIGSELQLFRAVLRWASTSCLRKGISSDPCTMREELKDILPYVRFLSMSQKEFAEEPVTSGLLTTEEKLQCLLAIVHPSLHDPPPTICALRHHRGLQKS